MPASGTHGANDGDDDLHASTRDYLLLRFSQIYPSDEAFDTERGTLVKIQHIRLLFGARPTAMWLSSRKKKVIDLDRVVFDPGGKYDAETSVNLFRGLDVPPEAGDCSKLLALLQFLCGEAGQDQAPITEWVLKWTALPLKRWGTKMQTAIVMHGEEGAGKNLFWGAVREIYGRHGGTITQMQLESQFNDWLSAKLFLIANEVVTQQHKRHHVGYLKNLITEPEIWINPKNIGARCEANHANLVFLSNELQPLQIGIRDRRYMVIHTPEALEREFYTAAAAEARAGGIAALHQHLLELDLGDFTEHTKPIVTAAKEALIEIGLNAPQLFWQELKSGELGLPYTPALVEDVYRAFRTWCDRNGEKMPQRINLFVPAFMSMNGIRRVKDRIPNPDLGARALVLAAGAVDADNVKLRQRKIFLMGNRDSDPGAERIRVRRGIAEFREALGDYIGTGKTASDGAHRRSESGDAF
jgi:putative DNA primase/helicase